MASRAASTLLALSAIVTLAVAAELPQSWPRCRRKDPALDVCLRHAIQVTLPQLATATPQFNLPALEPITLSNDFVLDRRPGRVSLEIKLANTKSYGATTMKVLNVYSDLENGIIDIYFHIPLSVMHGDMEVEGKIMHEPVSPQKGGVNFTFVGAEGFLVLSGHNMERDGDTYLEIDDVSISVLSLAGLGVHFDPLDSSPQRSAKLNYLLNANALALWPSLRDHLSTRHSEGLQLLANMIFQNVPVKEIFLGDDHPAVQAGPTSILLP